MASGEGQGEAVVAAEMLPCWSTGGGPYRAAQAPAMVSGWSCTPPALALLLMVGRSDAVRSAEREGAGVGEARAGLPLGEPLAPAGVGDEWRLPLGEPLAPPVALSAGVREKALLSTADKLRVGVVGGAVGAPLPLASTVALTEA